MSAHPNTVPQLDQRLFETRQALVRAAEDLRGQVREDIRDLSPRRQLRRHPEAVLTAAAVVGWLAGLLTGRIVALMF